MSEYIRKVPYFNDYEKKKDFLKYPHLKDDDFNKNENKKNNMNDIQYIIKKRENIKDIFNYVSDPDVKTRTKVLGDRKANLRNNLNENYYIHEKKNPFFTNIIVKKDEVAKTMKDVLYNKYEPDDTEKVRINLDVKTKVTLLEERKKLLLNKLNIENNIDKIILNPTYDYVNVVKNKNEYLVLKNYGHWITPSNFVFSYPHIQAKGKGGWASNIVESNIIENRRNNNEQINESNLLLKGKLKDKIIKKDKFFYMTDRFKYIDFYKNNCSIDNYHKEIPNMIIRSNGFQKWIN